MKTIQKFAINPNGDSQILTLKQGFQVARIEYSVTEKLINMWIEIPLRADIPEKTETFVVKKTNQAVPHDYNYIHTAVDILTPQAYHIFKLPEAAMTDKTRLEVA